VAFAIQLRSSSSEPGTGSGQEKHSPVGMTKTCSADMRREVLCSQRSSRVVVLGVDIASACCLWVVRQQRGVCGVRIADQPVWQRRWRGGSYVMGRSWQDGRLQAG
jgi:hypothetical protein